MFKNYFKTAIRNLLKFKMYSLISIVGLAIAIGCCITSFLFVHHEYSYDRFHENRNSIYRLCAVTTEQNGEISYRRTLPTPLLPKLTEAFPQIKKSVRCFETHDAFVNHNNAAFTEATLFADGDLLDMFTFGLVRGNPQTALASKHNVIISEKIAKKYFEREDPIGKTLSINHWKIGDGFRDFTITAVAQNVPTNSTIQFDILLPFKNIQRETRWSQYNSACFVQLHEQVDKIELEKLFMRFSKEHWPDRDRQLRLQPLTSVHINPIFASNKLETDSKPIYSIILSSVALIILLIASINFINISIGCYSARTQEVGIRKVIGATRYQLAKQFLSESILLCLLALILGIILTDLFLPTFNALSNQYLTIGYRAPLTLMYFIGLVIFVGLLSGLYPAFIVSGFRPAEVLKGKLRIGGNFFSRTLVTVQFILSIALVIAAIVMSRQLNSLTSDLGFEKDNIVSIDIPWAMDEMTKAKIYTVIRNELKDYSGIIQVSETGRGVTREIGSPISWIEHNGIEIDVWGDWIDHNYVDLLELELIEGRNFSKEFRTDAKEAVIVNQALLRKFGWKSGIGKELNFNGRRKIIGVVKDYHSVHKRNQIQATVLVLNQHPDGSPLIKIKAGYLRENLELIESKWKDVAAQYPFTFEFLDEKIAAEYWEEERMSKITQYAAAVCIFIACLGLLGLTSLSTNRRTKEIGIRKVLGASTSEILISFSKEFIVLILIANLIAWPIAWYAMHKWLQNFAYRIDLTVWPFLLAGMVALVIALLTVSWQAIRTAIANPVESLRYE